MLLEGQVFNDTYRLVRLIAEGGMGVVYEATHARLAGRYAIKVLLRNVSQDPEALARFHREARITSLLQHPNVVEVIDCNTTTDGTEYLVMEYLTGESLGQRLFREGPLPLDTVVGIIEQIAAGLAAAHADGIVHRDLKPDNVFLVPVEGRETESVKILDFGISKVKGPSWGFQAPEGTVCGTPQYMSPEQVEGRPGDVDAATDQFALAVLAYEMLTGRNPFQANSVQAIFSQVLNAVPAPTGIGHEVDAVLRRGLAKVSRRRFPCVTDFSDTFRGAAIDRTREGQRLATGAYAMGEISILKGTARSRRSHWGLTAVATVVASLSMSFVIGSVVPRRSPLVRAHSASAVANTIDRRAARLARLDEIPTSALPPPRIESQGSQGAQPSAGEELATIAKAVQPVIVPTCVRAGRFVDGARVGARP